MQGIDENGEKVTDDDLISPAEFLLLLSSPDIDPETDVEAMERLAHIMESLGGVKPFLKFCFVRFQLSLRPMSMLNSTTAPAACVARHEAGAYPDMVQEDMLIWWA